MWKLYFVLLSFLPQSISAAGLVPCGGAGEPVCQTCHAAQLINNIAAWIAGVMGILVVILIIYFALQMVVSAGQVSAKETAKRNITTALIGYAVVLGGWFIVDSVMKAFLNDQVFGVWNEVRCIAPTAPVRVGS